MQVQLALNSSDPNGYKSAISLATDLLARLDKTAFDRENTAQALTRFRELSYLTRGTAQLQLRNIPAARADFEAAKQIAPNDPRFTTGSPSWRWLKTMSRMRLALSSQRSMSMLQTLTRLAA